MLAALLCAQLSACSVDDDGDAPARDASAADVAADAGDGGAAPAVEAVPPEVAEHAGDWPLPNRDYDNTRADPDSPIRSDTIDGLREVWRLPLPAQAQSAFGRMTAPALVLGERVLTQDMGSGVWALDRGSGEVLWQRRTGGATVGPNGVAVGWGKLFANLGDTGIIALNLDDGAEVWRFEPELHSSEGVDITPTVHAGRVFVSTVPASLRGAYLGGSRGVLHALDQHDGTVRWRFDTVASDDLWGAPDVNSGGGAWYPPLIDVQSGITYWGTGNPAPFPGTQGAPSGGSRPGDNLYTSSVLAIDGETGELAWYHQERPHDLFDWDFQATPVRVRPEPGEDGPDLVVGAGKTGTVVALDPRTGELRWRAVVGIHENDDLLELPPDQSIEVLPGVLGGVLTPLAYAEGLIFAPVVNLASAFTGATVGLSTRVVSGELVALDAGDGHLVWSAELPRPTYAAATVVGDLVLTADDAGMVHAFARVDGEPVWSWQAPGGINAPLTVAGELLLVAAGVASDAALVALRL
jgi:outer membrane protein assembly factor BamB